MNDRRLARLTLPALIGLICLSINGCTPSEGAVAPTPEHVTVEPTQLPTAALTPTPSQPAPVVTVTPMPTIMPSAIKERRIITVEAAGLIINYSQGLYWGKERFDQEYDAYSVDKARYLEDFVEGFSKKFLKPTNLDATDWKVSFRSEYELGADKATYLALIQCKIHGAASGTAESPTLRTEWLLKPIFGSKPDLYDFEQPTDRTLVYEGEIDHIPITITFGFSKPINHCHYHVWYEH
jgi:hypothetical protein